MGSLAADFGCTIAKLPYHINDVGGVIVTGSENNFISCTQFLFIGSKIGVLISNNNLLRHAIYTTIVGNNQPYLVSALICITMNNIFAGAGSTIAQVPLPGLCGN